MAPALPVREFRRPAAPKNRLREQCRPATALFRDWLRPDKHASAKPAPATHAPHSGQPTPPASPEPTERDILLTPVPSPNPYGGTGRRNPGAPQLPQKIDWAALAPSPVEWVYINKLSHRFPEAWEYIRREALIYAGHDPDYSGETPVARDDSENVL